MLPEIERAVEQVDPRMLRELFESRKDFMKRKYGRFCLNKPKSEYIISQHNDKYFAVGAIHSLSIRIILLQHALY